MRPEGYAWLLDELGSHVIGVSDDVRASLLRYLPEQKVSTLFNGIDLEDMDHRALQRDVALRTELGLPDTTRIVLGVGRISAQKDFAAFARIAKSVVQKHLTVAFAIAGPAEDTSLYASLREQAADAALLGRLFLLGPRKDVPALVAQSDVFLSTSIFEGHPLTSLEAMSQRVPVVAMECVGLRDCIKHGVGGLLVPLGNEDACADAVLRVLSDADLTERLGQTGRRSVEEKFSADAYAQRFLAIAEPVACQYRPGSNAAAASFALGLLTEIQEAHRRLLKASQPKHGLVQRLRTRITAR
jgi:glycosyltransferase involved in cell wall biosynthesis